MHKELLLNDFDYFRKWFNQRFKLSLDGKFKGLSTLSLVLDWKRFAYCLFKLENGYYRKPVSDIITMRLSGHTIKLYAF